MKKILFSLLCYIPAIGIDCYAQHSKPASLVKYVNPMIGTEKMGHTYPGTTVLFGAVQLSLERDTIPYEMNGKYNGNVYNYCAEYKYQDKTITGFSHTHFSGTGNFYNYADQPRKTQLYMSSKYKKSA